MCAALKDLAYAAVGFAVIGTQRAQVRRRELQKQVEPTVRDVAGRAQQAAGAIDQRVDPVLDMVQDRLPDSGKDVVRQARAVAKEARDAVIGLAAAPTSARSGSRAGSGA